MNKLKSFLRRQTEVRLRRVIPVVAVVLLSALLTIPLVEYSDGLVSNAQTQMLVVPTANPAFSLVSTVNTALTTTATGFGFYGAGTNTTSTVNTVVGNHDVYGFSMYNNSTTNCYIQFYDQTVASITVGTTIPKFVLPVPAATTTSGGGAPIIYISPLPVFTISSTLAAAATATPLGNGSCITGGGGRMDGSVSLK